MPKQLTFILGGAHSGKLDRVNHLVASRSDNVYQMVVGVVLEMKSLGALPYSSLRQQA